MTGLLVHHVRLVVAVVLSGLFAVTVIAAPSAHAAPVASPQSVSSGPNLGRFLLSEEEIANQVHPDEELTLVYGPQLLKKSAAVGYSYLSVDVPKTAIVKMRTYKGTFKKSTSRYAKKGRYTTIRVTKKYWSGYRVRKDGIHYVHLNNVGNRILAEGILIIPLDSDNLDKNTAIITTRNLTLAQETKLNKAGLGTLR